jgi:CRISPR-associated helicase Cas3/CRISPR-associated endonuclease Cas3-HD
MKKYIAKSNGQDLKTHSLLTGRLAKLLAEMAGSNEEIQKFCLISGLGHDIGKVNNIFQSYIKGEKTDEKNEDFYLSYPMHHEISWAILSSEYNFSIEVLNPVYWHHSRPVNKNNKIFETDGEILNFLNDGEIKTIKDFFNDLLKSENIDSKSIESKNLELPPQEIPSLFVSEDQRRISTNPKILTVKSCLLRADHIISSLSEESAEYYINNPKELKNLVLSEKKLDIDLPKCPKEFNIDRYNNQLETLFDIQDHKSSVIKAPAGWGKTTLGILWAIKNNKKVFWVCPTNSIAYGVYKNILDAIDKLNIKISVQYHVSGMLKEHNCENDPEPFDANIVVTNIDTVLRPFSENSKSSQIFDVISSNIIFDEYHELISDAPLFSLFVILSRARTIHSNSKSIYLSATDANLYTMWDSDDEKNKVLIYPNKKEHLPAQHDNNYLVNIIEDPLNEIPEYKDGSIIYMNTIKCAQETFSKNNFYNLYHSKFIPEVRKEKLDEVLNLFGKKNCQKNMDKSACSTQILQCAVDISFVHTYEAVYTPESSLQRYGRNRRFGENDNKEHSINIFYYEDNSDRFYNINTYDNELRHKWFNFLKEKFKENKYANLKFFYEIYNEFNEKNSDDIKKYILRNHMVGLKSLMKMGSVKHKDFERKNKDNDISHQYKSLRNPLGNVFYSCEIKDENGNFNGKWLEEENIMSENVDIFQNSINKNGGVPSKEKMNKIINSTNGIFPEWDIWVKRSKKSIPLENLIKKIKYENTPYLFEKEDRYYDEVLGVVKN